MIFLIWISLRCHLWSFELQKELWTRPIKSLIRRFPWSAKNRFFSKFSREPDFSIKDVSILGKRGPLCYCCARLRGSAISRNPALPNLGRLRLLCLLTNTLPACSVWVVRPRKVSSSNWVSLKRPLVIECPVLSPEGPEFVYTWSLFLSFSIPPKKTAMHLDTAQWRFLQFSNLHSIGISMV